LRRPFVADAVFSMALVLSLAFIVISFFDKEGKAQDFARGVDWQMIPAAVLILFALWILAALALACSTRLDMMPTLAICTALFLLGIMSDYLFGRPAERGEWWASVLYTLTPNWQLFWLADALETGKNLYHWNYVGKALAYVAGYVGVALSLAVALFEERELS